MSLEKRINRALAKSNIKMDMGIYHDILDWRWYGSPSRDDMGYYLLYAPIHKLIKEALIVECLTSPSEYIREYRKWWENNKKEII